MIVRIIVADGHGGHVGITTPKHTKMSKNGNFKKIGKKVLGQGRSGHQKQGFFLP